MRVLLALLLVLPAVQGADLLSDGAGDVVVEVQDTAQPMPTDAYAYLDLVGLSVVETAASFTFTVHVADVKPSGEEQTEGGVVQVYFTHADTSFRLQIGRSAAFGDFLFANLFARGEGSWGHVWGTEDVVADASSDTYTVEVPREQLADQAGAPPFPGRTLTQFAADSASFLSDASFFSFGVGEPIAVPMRIVDRMPDSGFGALELPVTMGLVQMGSARLQSDEPRRASNGEASTFVFRVNATNTGEREAFYTFSVTGAPSNWGVALPQPAVQLAAGASKEIPVVLSTPFAHQHGSLETFILEMTDVEDAGSVGRIELGITYLEIPQPAGHHDTVYFHSRTEGSFLPVPIFSGAEAYMNAAETHTGDAGVDVPAWSWGINVRGDAVVSQFRWYLPLDPGLRMGLDFDTSRPGTITVPVATTFPQPGATVEGNIVLARGPDAWDLEDRIAVLATFASDPVDLGADSSHLFEMDVQVLKAADLVPYDPQQNMVLELFFNSTKPPSGTNFDAPLLQPGGRMTLPLFEYKDPVSGTFGDGVRLTASATSHMRNPGTTALFRAELAGPEGPYDLTLLGVNAQWATLGRERLTLGDAPQTVDVVVRVPADARDGDRADLVLQAAGPDGAALLRLVVDVDTDAEHPDDAGLVTEGGQAKSPAPLLALLALVGAALARRR